MKYSNTKPTLRRALSVGPASAVGIRVSTEPREGEQARIEFSFSEEKLSSLNSNGRLLSLQTSNGKRYDLCLMLEPTPFGLIP
jgi:hypothetical protein